MRHHYYWLSLLHSSILTKPELRFCTGLNPARGTSEIFFLSGSSFTTIHESQDLQGIGEGISLTPLYHFHPLYRHRDISRAITARSSPLHIGSSRTRTGTFGFRAQVANHQAMRPTCRRFAMMRISDNGPV